MDTNYDTQPGVEGERSLDTHTGTRVKPASVDTFMRTIDHSQKITPKDWISTQRDYRGRYLEEDPMKYLDPSAGPRERKEMALLFQTASTLPQRPEPETDLNSTHRTAFLPHTTIPASERGRRVMKDRDGRPAQRDATFLAESGLVPKGLADSHLVTEVPADFSTTLCTTGLSQPGNPPEYYKKYAEFTRDINHPVKARVNGIWDREW